MTTQNELKRFVRLRTYTEHGQDIVQSLIDCISFVEKHIDNFTRPMSSRSVKTASRSIVWVANDGEVCLAIPMQVNCYGYENNLIYGTYFTPDRSDEYIRNWLAYKLKDHVYKMLNKRGDYAHKAWSRSECSTVDLHDACFMIKDLYCIYDMLMGREKLERRYDESTLTTTRGIPRDPFLSEQFTVMEHEIASIKQESKTAIEALKSEMDSQISEARATFDNIVSNCKTEYLRKKAESENNFNKKIEEMLAQMKQLQEVATSVA